MPQRRQASLMQLLLPHHHSPAHLHAQAPAMVSRTGLLCCTTPPPCRTHTQNTHALTNFACMLCLPADSPSRFPAINKPTACNNSSSSSPEPGQLQHANTHAGAGLATQPHQQQQQQLLLQSLSRQTHKTGAAGASDADPQHNLLLANRLLHASTTGSSSRESRESRRQSLASSPSRPRTQQQRQEEAEEEAACAKQVRETFKKRGRLCSTH